ncbi:MAG: O-succinylhomoserine sulfhydrylase [Rhodobiaceae bacterium]|nr:O-succinylhomoserine sulfhydrylase [Rhodobiaceae bacterium]MCC0015703.1 O-succinylhomoserine sulfhydrylase [Rhodobiaceae bacterium]MCC0042191.1 O-succinylhomoserine sulfhydrylase [Rhodobiaceae bacterium]MCC0053962.1 O-succinylhomoserine sulfhydrylase [Rhodobiaceae bacterium]
MTHPENPLAGADAETLLVHGGQTRSPHGETAEALYLTSGYVYDSAELAEARFKGEQPGYVYSRYGNPTVSMFENRMAAMEGAQGARATASGMAAVNAAILGLVKAGDHVVASRALFGSCLFIIETLLPRFGVETTLVEGGDLEEWRAAVRENTKLFFLETPSNPTLRLIDLKAVADIAHDAGALLVVDNVFATPLLQKPMQHGADIVVYSATKHIDGQGRCLGGVILGPTEVLDGQLKDFLRHTGPSLSPFNAWVLLKGLETLPLRVERQCANAAAAAELLAGDAGVSRVLYPGRADHPDADLVKQQMSGGGTMVAVDFKGGKRAAFAFLNALRLIRISNNLGDSKSLATHPATTTHQRLTPDLRADLGIGDGLVRISLGIESGRDLAADIAQALAAARG